MIAATLVTGSALLLSSFKGDFDHDGKQDVARIVRRTTGHFELVITRAADPHRPVVVDTEKELDNFYVVRAKPGRYESACHKGYDVGPDDPGCKRPWIKLRGDNLAFGIEESSEAIVVWTGKRFEVIWVSD